MTNARSSGNELCYLDGRQSVFPAPDLEMTEPTQNASAENRWLARGRSVLAGIVVLVLLALGIANVALYSRWHEVEDGVFWDQRGEGVTAVEIVPGSAADAAGLQRGDVLLAVNGSPIQSPSDVIEYQHRGHEGTRLTYTLLRLHAEQALNVVLTPTPRASSMYYLLAAVGMFTLLVGGSVRLRRPRDQATLHFFWICVAPVENPVETIERTGEREGEDAEERDADPEEMQRRLITRTTQPHRAADEQRKHAEGGEQVVHRARARRRRQYDVQRPLGMKTQQRVGEPRAFVAAMLVFDDVGRRLNRRAVDREQHVAALQACGIRGRSGDDLDRGDPFAALIPEDPVFDFVPARVQRDVREAKGQEHQNNDAGKHRPPQIGRAH